MMNKSPRIVFLSSRDIRNYNAFVHFSMASAIEKYIGQVTHIQYPKPTRKYSIRWLKSKCCKAMTRRNEPKYTEESKEHAKIIKKLLQREKFDVLFAPMGAMAIAYLDIPQPIIYLSDATSKLMRGYYYSYNTNESAMERDEVECAALHNSTYSIASNRWAAHSMIMDYKVPKSKLYVVPFGPNIEHVSCENVILRKNLHEDINLLMVAKDWQRKGGVFALETLETLLAKGYNAELTICGMNPACPYDEAKVRVVPYLDKTKAKDRKRFFQMHVGSHFYLHPSRAECEGVAMIEAIAFGTPVLANNTGGISSYVKNGLSGFLFEPHHRGDKYAEKIIELVQQPKYYQSLSRRTRTMYEAKFNWKSWAQSFSNILSKINT